MAFKKKTDVTDITPKSDSGDKPYMGASKEEVLALWEKFGRDKVKGLPGFRDMSMGAIAKALSK